MMPRNHSVVLMQADSPCIPYNKADPTIGNAFWWSGFYNFTSDDYTQVPYNQRTFMVKVENDKPMYFYCSQKESCETYGMVGVING